MHDKSTMLQWGSSLGCLLRCKILWGKKEKERNCQFYKSNLLFFGFREEANTSWCMVNSSIIHAWTTTLDVIHHSFCRCQGVPGKVESTQKFNHCFLICRTFGPTFIVHCIGWLWNTSWGIWKLLWTFKLCFKGKDIALRRFCDVDWTGDAHD